jgi:tyrosine-protein phosphatase YwqE
LARTGLAHLIASDAHAGDVRSLGMTAARQVVGDERLAGWLIDDVPVALVEGRPLPVRPEAARRRRLLRRR